MRNVVHIHYNVSGLDPKDAIQLHLSFAMTKGSADNQRLASVIVKELGYLALAIVQAGADISQSCNIDEFLETFKAERAQLMQTHSVQTLDDYQLAVYTTWESSWNQLSATAASLLHLCAYCITVVFLKVYFKRLLLCNMIAQMMMQNSFYLIFKL
jgi:hypothetical protein